jgi:hypothetical protein
VLVVDGTFRAIPTVGILWGGRFSFLWEPYSGQAVNSLTAISVLAGGKLVLFSRYILNFYVGVAQ